LFTTTVLRERAALTAVDRVAGHEAVHADPDSLDDSGEVVAALAGLRLPDARLQARDIGAAGEAVPVDRVQRRRVDTHEHASVRRLRLFHILQDERSVLESHCRLHHISLRCKLTT
jgi:hypothetical protein